MSDSTVREPIFNAPGATIVVVALIILMHAALEYLVTEDWRLITSWGFTPLRLLAQWDPEAAQRAVQELASAGAQAREGSLAQVRAALGAYVLNLADDGLQSYATLVTHAALHGGWPHAIINSLWLAVFGSAVNRRFGSVRFLALGALSAIGGALAQMAIDPASPLPMIGASGAVSGYTGAMTRFAFAPGAPLGPWRAHPDEAYCFPAPPIAAILRDQRAFMFAASWFVLNFISGVGAMPLGGSEAPVAWVAHMGGFLAGFLFFGWLDPVGKAGPSDGARDLLPPGR